MIRKRKRKFGRIRQLFGDIIKEYDIFDSRVADGLCRRRTTGIVLARSPNL